MSPAPLIVKNMVCNRCILAVEGILARLEIPHQEVRLGEILLHDKLSAEKKEQLQEGLTAIGFELIDTHLGSLIENIKKHVITKARNEVDEKDQKLKLSNYLSSKLNHEYTYLSSLFSSVEGRTIENYFNEQRIEKAKELIVYGQQTLSEISFDLDYSSVAHLSSQFKKVTGLTPSAFKSVSAAKRRTLDSI